MATATVLSPAIQTAKPRLWVPRQVLVTPEALRWKHGEAIVERAAAFGSEIVELKSNRLTGLRGGTEREEYVRAKTTLAVVVASESARKLQPIPPSADWQFHIAEGCPAHCQYCYLAGSLSGPPVTRAYANLPEILDNLPKFLGAGQVTSASGDRRHEGTTVSARLQALRKVAAAGYPVGLTIAPIMPVENWREEYRELLRDARAALADIPELDLTVEMITHRFTAKSKLVQLGWYPKTKLSLDESLRTRKMTKFGSPKFVYPKDVAGEMRSWFDSAVAEELPLARTLYWT